MKSTIDFEAVRELELYAENTSSIYHNNTMPTVTALKKKYEKGIYDKEKVEPENYFQGILGRSA